MVRDRKQEKKNSKDLSQVQNVNLNLDSTRKNSQESLRRTWQPRAIGPWDVSDEFKRKLVTGTAGYLIVIDWTGSEPRRKARVHHSDVRARTDTRVSQLSARNYTWFCGVACYVRQSKIQGVPFREDARDTAQIRNQKQPRDTMLHQLVTMFRDKGTAKPTPDLRSVPSSRFSTIFKFCFHRCVYALASVQNKFCLRSRTRSQDWWHRDNSLICDVFLCAEVTLFAQNKQTLFSQFTVPWGGTPKLIALAVRLQCPLRYNEPRSWRKQPIRRPKYRGNNYIKWTLNKCVQRN